MVRPLPSPGPGRCGVRGRRRHLPLPGWRWCGRTPQFRSRWRRPLHGDRVARRPQMASFYAAMAGRPRL